jgi:environmental stress-induced protein Ves
MTWQFVSLADVVATPWRNGGGSTRELLAWPDGTRWQVRISIADIGQDGPFSSYPGIERWFAVLEGAGVDLRVAGAPLRLQTGSQLLRFDGAAAVDCALLDGPTRDFNLMAAPGAAQLRRLAGVTRVAWAAHALVALYSHRAAARIGHHEIPAGTLAWRVMDEAATFEIEGEDALWMKVTV